MFWISIVLCKFRIVPEVLWFSRACSTFLLHFRIEKTGAYESDTQCLIHIKVFFNGSQNQFKNFVSWLTHDKKINSIKNWIGKELSCFELAASLHYYIYLLFATVRSQYVFEKARCLTPRRTKLFYALIFCGIVHFIVYTIIIIDWDHNIRSE